MMNKITFKRRLESVLSDNRFDRKVTGKRTGKLDTKRLHKISISQKLFKKNEERKNKNYSVVLLVDCSGSMSGSKADMAGKAAALLGEQLHKLGVSLEIYGFNQVLFPLVTAKEKKPNFYVVHESIKMIAWGLNDILEDTETNTLHHISDPDFEEVKKKIAKQEGVDVDDIFIECSSGSNSDGEMVHVVARKLLKAKGKKIFIVLSDGQPTSEGQWSRYVKNRRIDSFNLKHEVQDAINKGITFIGIGIHSSCVEEYYPKENTAVIRNIEELYPAIIGKLNKLIKRG